MSSTRNFTVQSPFSCKLDCFPRLSPILPGSPGGEEKAVGSVLCESAEPLPVSGPGFPSLGSSQCSDLAAGRGPRSSVVTDSTVVTAQLWSLPPPEAGVTGCHYLNFQGVWKARCPGLLGGSQQLPPPSFLCCAYSDPVGSALRHGNEHEVRPGLPPQFSLSLNHVTS